MRIFEIMSFDPSWFFTVPGLLITGGVLLLLIALIVFVATSKKDKGAVVDPTVDGSIPLVEGPDNMNNGINNVGIPNNVNNQYVNQMPIDNMVGMNTQNNQNVGTMGMNDMNTFNQMGVVNQGPMMPDYNNMGNVSNGQGFNPSVPMGNVNSQPIPMENPVLEQAMPTPDVPVMPTNTNIEFSGVPGVTISDTVDPEMKPVIDLGPVSPNPVVDFSAPATPSVEQTTPVVENSFVNNQVEKPINRPIYGGANPLENTASIPTVINHSAYNGEPIIPNSVMNEVKVMDNTPSVNVETPAIVNNEAQPIRAADIFNSTMDNQQSDVIAQPTPIVEGVQSVNNQTQPNDGGVETLKF